MKLFIVLCALAGLVLSETTRVKSLIFNFDQGDGVDVEPFTLPFNYAGSVNISMSGTPSSDMFLCIHWVVPVVAPFGENLDLGDIWEDTCTQYFPVTAGVPFSANEVSLRSGQFYFSAAVTNNDIDSTGIVNSDDFDFTATVTYKQCDADKFGENCDLPFSPLSYVAPTTISVGDTPLYFSLPTMDIETETETLDVFASSLKFSFDSPTTDVTNDATFTLKYRLNGSPENVNDGDECHSSSSCVIENPPFTATPDYQWGVSISASTMDNTPIVISVAFKWCDKGEIGEDCEDYQKLDSDMEVGEVKKFSKKTILVFDSAVSVAVGGLDGYEQQDVAPAVNVQVDAEPSDDVEFDVLLSEGARANVAIFDLTSSGPDSKIVLSINPSKSFGIWIVNDTVQCPDGCSDHGTCSTQEFVCECDDDYEDLDCDHEVKDFTIEYIILIAVGSILILAILIGVPIYCYLNRNQEYDIVA